MHGDASSNEFSYKYGRWQKAGICSGIVTTRHKGSWHKRKRTGYSSTIPISHRRLAGNAIPFSSLLSAVTLFISLQSSPSHTALFSHSRVYTVTQRLCFYSPPFSRRVASSLFRDSRNRVLPARKLPHSLWLFPGLPLLPVILRRTLHVLVYLALGITNDGRKEPSRKQVHHRYSGRHAVPAKSADCYHRQDCGKYITIKKEEDVHLSSVIINAFDLLFLD